MAVIRSEVWNNYRRSLVEDDDDKTKPVLWIKGPPEMTDKEAMGKYKVVVGSLQMSRPTPAAGIREASDEELVAEVKRRDLLLYVRGEVK